MNMTMCTDRSPRHRRTKRWSAGLLVAGFVLFPAVARAHNKLISSVPPKDGTLTVAPRELRLKFAEAVELAISSVTLTGPDGAKLSLGMLAPAVDSRVTLVASVPAGLTGATAFGYEYDFFEKDLLGNICEVLTQQKDTAKDLAFLEGAYRNTELQLFNGITTTVYPRNKVSGNPVDLSVTNPNDSVAKVNGNGPRDGPSLLLKVMRGDKLDIGVKSFFNGNGSANSPVYSLNDVLNSLVSGIVQMTAGSKGSTTQS